MNKGQSEVIILRPTSVFLAFLASQLPANEVPSPATLAIDNTAYVLAKQDSEDATINEIKKHFLYMFRYEISRWLGKTARNTIEKSFIDFLCCFKFHLHSHIILMESTLDEGEQLILIKPREPLFNWLKETVADNEGLTQVLEKTSLVNLTENATVLVKNFPVLSQIKPFLQHYYKPIFETAMSRISNHKSQWPSIYSFSDFCRYFTIEIHTHLIHLPHYPKKSSCPRSEKDYCAEI